MPEWETRQAWEGIFPVQEEGELLLSLLRIVWPELLGAELVFSYSRLFLLTGMVKYCVGNMCSRQLLVVLDVVIRSPPTATNASLNS